MVKATKVIKNTVENISKHPNHLSPNQPMKPSEYRETWRHKSRLKKPYKNRGIMTSDGALYEIQTPKEYNIYKESFDPDKIIERIKTDIDKGILKTPAGNIKEPTVKGSFIKRLSLTDDENLLKEAYTQLHIEARGSAKRMGIANKQMISFVENIEDSLYGKSGYTINSLTNTGIALLERRKAFFKSENIEDPAFFRNMERLENSSKYKSYKKAQEEAAAQKAQEEAAAQKAQEEAAAQKAQEEAAAQKAQEEAAATTETQGKSKTVEASTSETVDPEKPDSPPAATKTNTGAEDNYDEDLYTNTFADNETQDIWTGGDEQTPAEVNDNLTWEYLDAHNQNAPRKKKDSGSGTTPAGQSGNIQAKKAPNSASHAYKSSGKTLEKLSKVDTSKLTQEELAAHEKDIDYHKQQRALYEAGNYSDMDIGIRDYIGGNPKTTATVIGAGALGYMALNLGNNRGAMTNKQLYGQEDLY